MVSLSTPSLLTVILKCWESFSFFKIKRLFYSFFNGFIKIQKERKKYSGKFDPEIVKWSFFYKWKEFRFWNKPGPVMGIGLNSNKPISSIGGEESNLK